MCERSPLPLCAAVMLLLFGATSLLGCVSKKPERAAPKKPGEEICNVVYLPPLEEHGNEPYTTQTEALALNDAGQVVGFSRALVRDSDGDGVPEKMPPTVQRLPVVWGFFRNSDDPDPNTDDPEPNTNDAEAEGFECDKDAEASGLVPCVRKLTVPEDFQGVATDIANPSSDDSLGTAVGWAGEKPASKKAYRWPSGGSGEDISGGADLKYPVAWGVNSQGTSSGSVWASGAQNTIQGFIAAPSLQQVTPQLRRIIHIVENEHEEDEVVVAVAAGSEKGSPVIYRHEMAASGSSDSVPLGGSGSALDLVADDDWIVAVGSAHHSDGGKRPAFWRVPPEELATDAPQPVFLQLPSEDAADELPLILGGSAFGVSKVEGQLQVVGTAPGPFVWTLDEGGKDLNALMQPTCVGRLLEANDVNSSGHIVGVATINIDSDGDGESDGSARRGFFIRPQVVTTYENLAIRKEVTVGEPPKDVEPPQPTPGDGKVHIYSGMLATFRFHLTQEHNVAIPSRIQETLPSGVQFVAAEVGGDCQNDDWELNGEVVRTNVSLPPEGCFLDMLVEVTGNPGDEITNDKYELRGGNNTHTGDPVTLVIDETPPPTPRVQKWAFSERFPGWDVSLRFQVYNASSGYTVEETLPAGLENPRSDTEPSGCQPWGDPDNDGVWSATTSSPDERVCYLLATIGEDVEPGTVIMNDEYRMILADAPTEPYPGRPYPIHVYEKRASRITGVLLDATAELPDPREPVIVAPGSPVLLAFIASGTLVEEAARGDCDSGVVIASLPDELQFASSTGMLGEDCVPDSAHWVLDPATGKYTAPIGGPATAFDLYGSCPMLLLVSPTATPGTVGVTEFELRLDCDGEVTTVAAGSTPELTVTEPPPP